MNDESFDQHQSGKSLAQANAVAEKGEPIRLGNAEQVSVGVLLVAIEFWKQLGLCAVPDVGRECLTVKQFVQRLDPDFVGRSQDSVFLDDLEHVRADVLSLFPVTFVPLLQQTDIRAADLNIQFDVVGQARDGEVGRPDQRE